MPFSGLAAIGNQLVPPSSPGTIGSIFGPPLFARSASLTIGRPVAGSSPVAQLMPSIVGVAKMNSPLTRSIT